MIGLVTIHTLADATRGRAEMLAAQGQVTGQTLGAELVYETFFTTAGALLLEGVSPQPGWAKTVLTLCGRGDRPGVDALASTRLDQARIRLAAVLDVPEIVTLTSLEEVHAAISAAIEVGAQRYNQGDIVGCGIKYWAVAHTLLVTPTLQASPSFLRALEPIRTTMRKLAGLDRLDSSGIDAFAWELRHAFDAALEVRGQSRPLQ
ncbi:MAG TPA: hypothetical protein VF807_11045 [Ktedonobacterales bacterium]